MGGEKNVAKRGSLIKFKRALINFYKMLKRRCCNYAMSKFNYKMAVTKTIIAKHIRRLILKIDSLVCVFFFFVTLGNDEGDNDEGNDEAFRGF